MAQEVALDQVKLQADIASTQAKMDTLKGEMDKLKGQLPPNEKLMTTTRLGYLKTGGNTKTETFAVDARAKKAWGNHNFSAFIDAQYVKDELRDEHEQEVTNKYVIEAEYGYLMTENLSFTYLLGFKQDKFSVYNYQAYTGPGLKYAVLKSTKQALDVEANILYSKDELRSEYQHPSFNDTYSSYRAKAVYGLQLLENLKFDQELSYRSSFEDDEIYFVFSNSALSSKISDMFSAGISYKIDYTNTVAPGMDRQETTLAAFLSIDY